MKNSSLFQALTRSLEEQAFKIIKESLDKRPAVELSEDIQMSFYPDCTMKRIKKTYDDRYILVTEDNSGEREFDLDDWGCVPITDLLHILEQLEREEEQ